MRRLEQRYMWEQMETEDMNQTQQSPWLVNNILFCYEGDKHSRRARKSTGRRVGYIAVFQTPPELGHIQKKPPFTWNVSNEKDKRERGHKMGNIYRLCRAQCWPSRTTEKIRYMTY